MIRVFKLNLLVFMVVLINREFYVGEYKIFIIKYLILSRYNLMAKFHNIAEMDR